MCGNCHAIGRTDRSPHIGAPAFRSLDKRLDLDAFMERLRNGLTSGHPDMPTFQFTRNDTRKLIYGNSTAVGNLRQVLKTARSRQLSASRRCRRDELWISAPGKVKLSNAEVRSAGPICIPKTPNCTAEIERGLLQTEQF